MTAPLGWGILGAGGIAATFAKDLVATGHRVAAVGSRDHDKATAFATTAGIPTAHGSYRELVADPNVDIVYVATPHPMHAEHAVLALNAGKHVLVEKPFTINALEAEGVLALAAQRGLVALEAMWTRWLPHMVRIREIVASDGIGEVRSVIVGHHQLLSGDPTNRLMARELGGGALLDLGIYPVSFAWDILRLGAGSPENLRATATMTATGVDEQTSILFTSPTGAHAVITTALSTKGPNTASIIGTHGRIEISETWFSPRCTATVISNDGTVVEVIDGATDCIGFHFEAREVERLVAEGATASEVLPPEETLAIMKTLDEVRRQIGLRYPTE